MYGLHQDLHSKTCPLGGKTPSYRQHWWSLPCHVIQQAIHDVPYTIEDNYNRWGQEGPEKEMETHPNGRCKGEFLSQVGRRYGKDRTTGSGVRLLEGDGHKWRGCFEETPFPRWKVHGDPWEMSGSAVGPSCSVGPSCLGVIWLSQWSPPF